MVPYHPGMPHRPGLLLYVPGNWDADPVALAELRRHLSDEYGATLEVRQASTAQPSPALLYTGVWPSWPGEDLHPWIAAAFFTLDWVLAGDVE